MICRRAVLSNPTASGFYLIESCGRPLSEDGSCPNEEKHVTIAYKKHVPYKKYRRREQ